MKNYTYMFSQYLEEAGVEEYPPEFIDHPMKWTPRPSQISGLNRCLSQPKWGLYDDAGTGKSTILYGSLLYFTQWGNRVLAIMPPILFDQFVDNLLSEFKGCEEYVNYEIFDKTPKHRQKTFDRIDEGENINLLVMTYEMFIKEKERLWERCFSVVICDEAHKLRNGDSNFYSSVYNYTNNKETVLLVATGTPIFHTLVDAFAMTNITARDTYKSLASFKRLHCNMKRFMLRKKIRGRVKRIWVDEIVSFKNLDTLHRKLYNKARRVTKEQVLSLKEPTIVMKTLRMSPAHRKLYNQMAVERMLELPDDMLITGQQAVQLREHLMQIACNAQSYTDKKIQDVLFDQLLELIEETTAESKLVVYAHHNVTLEGLQDRLENQNPALVYGGSRSSSSKNKKQISKFLTDEDCKILLAHPQSAGVGLNLEHVSNYVCFYEPTPIHGQFSQAMDRVFRGEQPKAVVVFILRLLGTVYPNMVSTMLDNSESAGIVNCDKSTFKQWVYDDESL